MKTAPGRPFFMGPLSTGLKLGAATAGSAAIGWTALTYGSMLTVGVVSTPAAALGLAAAAAVGIYTKLGAAQYRAGETSLAGKIEEHTLDHWARRFTWTMTETDGYTYSPWQIWRRIMLLQQGWPGAASWSEETERIVQYCLERWQASVEAVTADNDLWNALPYRSEFSLPAEYSSKLGPAPFSEDLVQSIDNKILERLREEVKATSRPYELKEKVRYPMGIEFLQYGRSAEVAKRTVDLVKRYHILYEEARWLARICCSQECTTDKCSPLAVECAKSGLPCFAAATWKDEPRWEHWQERTSPLAPGKPSPACSRGESSCSPASPADHYLANQRAMMREASEYTQFVRDMERGEIAPGTPTTAPRVAFTLHNTVKSLREEVRKLNDQLKACAERRGLGEIEPTSPYNLRSRPRSEGERVHRTAKRRRVAESPGTWTGAIPQTK